MENENSNPEQILIEALEKVKEITGKETDAAPESAKSKSWKKAIEHFERGLKVLPDSEKTAQTEGKTLHLAITMAGAISAGAYTAGVMDYLLEVLDRWADLKKKNDPRVPTHNIQIEVLSGASAGGITAAITSVALHRKDRSPIRSFNSEDEEKHRQNLSDKDAPDRRKLNRLYNAWVNLADEDMMPVLLQTGDSVTLADGKKPCISVLNSDFAEKIANNTVQLNREDINSSLPEYVNNNFRLFLTLTNLDGFQKKVSLGRGGQYFRMIDHRDAILFRFNDYQNPQDKNDGSIWVKFEGSDYGTVLLKKAAMATGAFPIGLAYRTFSRDRRHIANNILLEKLHGKIELPDENYRSTFIDGGLIDNEPFELTHYLLGKMVENERISSSSEHFNSTILMIDPFPSEERDILPRTPNNGVQPFGFFGVVAKFFAVLLNQVIVKHNIIEEAFNKDNYSCFVIAPSRHAIQSGEPINYSGNRAIACGTLGGFGGFVSKDFREHDFYLGRINCKSFLQNHFRIPIDTQNPIFKDAYSPEAIRHFKIKDEETGEEFLPILPDVNKLSTKDLPINLLYKNLKFPSYSPSRFKRLREKANNRIDYIFETNADFSGFGRVLGYLAKFYVRANLIAAKRFLFDKLSKAITVDLDTWEMNEDKKNPESKD